jgi:hypothetical protein
MGLSGRNVENSASGVGMIHVCPALSLAAYGSGSGELNYRRHSGIAAEMEYSCQSLVLQREQSLSQTERRYPPSGALLMFCFDYLRMDSVRRRPRRCRPCLLPSSLHFALL